MLTASTASQSVSRSSTQVTQDRVVAMSLAPGKLIDPQIARRWQLPTLLQAQSTLGELDAGHALQTPLHKPGADLILACHMRDGASPRLLADLFAQAHRCSLASATCTVAFGERFAASHAPEAPFVQHQLDHMPAQRHIAFAARTHIMLFDAHRSTMRALLPFLRGDHLDPELPIRLHLLPADTQTL